jgi:acetate kinase
MKILVANIGSTSFKYKLLAVPGGSVLAEGRTERIGKGGGCPDYRTAITRCLEGLCSNGGPLSRPGELDGVGFKAVLARGVSGARIVDEEVLAAMEEWTFLAPAHNPPYVDAMRAFGGVAPGVPLVALFETAFFDALDGAVSSYAVPAAWAAEGVRRLGFHGASHRHAAERVETLLGRGGLRHVSCHLGGSSSVAAILGGRAVNTSFGMSPQSGLPQTNRCGDIDVFAVLHMMKKHGWGPDETARILGRESGLAGISGTSGDVRDLRAAEGRGEMCASLALGHFVASTRHYLGAFMLQLGGLDAVSFSGGTGERDPQMRADICRGLEGFGISLDPDANRGASGEIRVSSVDSAVEVWVVPADEERIVARETARVIREKAGDAAGMTFAR